MHEDQEDALRGGLSSVIGRYETARDLHFRMTGHLARAMALDAVRALAEAYPDDPFYRRRLDEWLSSSE